VGLTLDNTGAAVIGEPSELGVARFPSGGHSAHAELVRYHQNGFIALNWITVHVCVRECVCTHS